MADNKVPAIGIDLGTTYSCVGVLQHGRVEIIANEHGDRTTPSFVAFTNTEVLVGKAAKDQVALNADNTVYDVKRLIGRQFQNEVVQNDCKLWPFKVIDADGKPKIKVHYKGEDKEYYPEEISAMVLTYMKDTAESYLGHPVKNAVITVPAYFNDAQRRITNDAGTIAGLNVMRIINEPTAAAFAYGFDKEVQDLQNILVFDIGGGTCDVSILSLEKGLFKVISTAGDTHLGGEDFDNRIVDHFLQRFKQMHKEDLTGSKKSLQKLRKECEKAKRTLSSSTHANIAIDSLYNGIDFCAELSRAKFESLNADLFRKAMESVQKALDDARIKKSQINEIVLVGGSSRIPKIQSMFSEFFEGKELNKSINPDEAVAYGATIQASILNGDGTKMVRDLILQDVTPISLGVEVASSEDDSRGNMDVIIKRNTAIPAEKTVQYSTKFDDQTEMAIKVYEGEYPKVTFNNLLGEFVLTNIPPAPAGISKADVTFHINANGILNVKAVQPDTKSENSITITNSKACSDIREMNKMLENAEKYRVDLEKFKLARGAKNSLESYTTYVMNSMDDGKSMVNNVSKRNLINDKCNEIFGMLNSSELLEKEVYESKQNDLKKLFLSVTKVQKSQLSKKRRKKN